MEWLLENPLQPFTQRIRFRRSVGGYFFGKFSRANLLIDGKSGGVRWLLANEGALL